MNKTIELNEQQIEFLKTYLSHAIYNEFLSNTSIEIISQILIKIEN